MKSLLASMTLVFFSAMRLNLETSSAHRALDTSASRRLSTESALSSVFIPINVDDDSSDGAEPLPTHQLAALPLPNRRPSLFNPAFGTFVSSISTKRRNSMIPGTTNGDSTQKHDAILQNSSNTSTREQDEETTKPPLNFFYNHEVQSTPSKLRRENTSHCVHDYSSPAVEKLHEVISATRSSICGQKFDRCELEFSNDYVKLAIWEERETRWKGSIKYAHMVRFCFAPVGRPPYILLLQLDSIRGRSDFASFYDPIFAKVWEDNEARKQISSKLYGVVFYFEEELDYIRCQSMSDKYPKLAHLFHESLSESEVRECVRLDASSRLRPRVDYKSSTFKTTGGRNLALLVGNQARSAIDSVASFFRPTSRPSVLENENFSVISDSGNSTRGKALDFTQKHHEESATDMAETKITLLNDHESSNGKKSLGSIANAASELLKSYTQQDVTHERGLTMTAPFSIPQDENTSATIESSIRPATSRREADEMKRRQFESRRNEVLLTYPYDGSDASGRISVTLGDVDRLAPGEFLNDNIIDFYLRFLWRHLSMWQQLHTCFFTSHFFTQLHGTNGAFELNQAGPDERFARVARWTQKETNLFEKRFLFIPINDSFHWSIAVFCNPGSAIIKKRRLARNHHETVSSIRKEVVNLVDSNVKPEGACGTVDGDTAELLEEVLECKQERLANPPCLLFLDSLRCHRKKKFTKLLRHYLECEWKARYASSAESGSTHDDRFDKDEATVTFFDSESIRLLEPNIPLQSNSSDCGVYLLMYAASIVHHFPAGVTRENLENNLTSTLTSGMFQDEHVLEFREYLHQLLFCLQFFANNGISEDKIKDEELETFEID
ncbi:hypothetical protein CCR75_002714 [Bremia lactucae]|uniref:Ubiquitin-like protease family profile domain-containing protein n=1 Tax=Bremia lactucae TaxID=4779 RepID=A0A976FR29_BRELC|nr:hypothetical protein CCR75_002714 [Bremia lactucae]